MGTHFIRKFGLMLLDTLLIWLAVSASFLLRFDGNVPHIYLNMIRVLFGIMPMFRIPFLIYSGMYGEILRYAGPREFRITLGAVFSGSVILMGLKVFGLLAVPRSILILEGILSLVFLAAARVIPRLMSREVPFPAANQKRILVVGAGDAGITLLKSIMRRPNMRVVCLVDDDPAKQGRAVSGIPVMGGRDAIPGLAKRYEVDEIALAMPSTDRQEIRKIVELCRRHCPAVPIKILPSFYAILSGQVEVTDLREVTVEDLLGRPPIKVSRAEACKYLQGQVVMVTGAGGSIGSELCRQVAICQPARLILLGHGENSIYEIGRTMARLYPNLPVTRVIADIRETEKIDGIFAKYRPTVVYHAAAYKHVPLMEENPEEAFVNNVWGTYNLVNAADKYEVQRFILVSTDKAVQPTSIMGASKRVSEMILQEKAKISRTSFMAVRFGNVLGSRGSVIPLFKQQIEEGGPVTVTHPEMTRYFMTIPEAVQLVIHTGAMGRSGEIYLLNMGDPVKIVDLAEHLIKLSGLEPGKDIEIVFTGIRPGEKLHEDLHFDAETMDKTSHEQIWALRNVGNGMGWGNLEAELERLWELARGLESDRVRQGLTVLAYYGDAQELPGPWTAAQGEAAASQV